MMLRALLAWISTIGMAACSGNFLGTSRGCPAVYIPSETTITVQSPGNLWTPGAYTAVIAYDAITVHCSMSITGGSLGSPIPLDGGCDATNVTLQLAPVCKPPTTMCSGNVCSGTFSASDCYAGQFRMLIIIGPVIGSDSGTSGNPSEVALDVAMGANDLANVTLM